MRDPAEPIGQIWPESRFGRLLTELTKQCNNIVEIGTWRGGGSTMCISRGLVRPEQRFFTIETDASCIEEAKSRFSDDRIIFLHGTVLEVGDIFPLETYDDPELKRAWRNEYDNIYHSKCVINELPETIDLLLIDGGDMAAEWEFAKLFDRCSIIALDDSGIQKNKANREKLMGMGWRVIADVPCGTEGRHGYFVAKSP